MTLNMQLNSVMLENLILANGLLSPRELDLIGRHLPAHKRPRTNARYSSFQVHAWFSCLDGSLP